MKTVAANMDEQVAEWVCAHVPELDLNDMPFTAIGQLDRYGHIIGGAVFTTFTGRDIHIHCAGIKKRWLSRRFLGEVYRYVFQHLGCRRVTALVRAQNKEAIQLIESLGYKYEGILRAFMANDEDCLIFGMLREECRWLTVGVLKHGYSKQQSHTAGIQASHATRPTPNADGKRVIPSGRRAH